MIAGEFLFELAWRSALVSLVVLLIARCAVPARGPRRTQMLKLGVLVLLMLPASMLLPAIEAPWLTPVEIAQAPAAAIPPTHEAAVEAGLLARPVAELLYGLGVLALLVWTTLGVLTLRRWTRAAEPVASPRWKAALDRTTRASGVRNVRVSVTDRIKSPISWGVRRPVILLDHATVRLEKDAEGVLAHELAHIRHKDWVMLIACRLTTALLWFNPLVWLLRRELVQALEHEADSAAIAQVDRVAYADLLLRQVERPRSLILANTIASSCLGQRIEALLRNPSPDGRRPSHLLMAGAWMALCFAVPMAALRFVPPVMAAQPVPAVGMMSIPPRSTMEARVASKTAFIHPAAKPLANPVPPIAASSVTRGFEEERAAKLRALRQAEASSRDAEQRLQLAEAAARQVEASTASAATSDIRSQRDWADGERGAAAGDLGRATGDAARANADRIWAQIELDELNQR